MELSHLARLARNQAHGEAFCRDIASANTARHALELLLARQASGVIQAVGREALEQSARITDGALPLRLLLFDYDGTLLLDLRRNVQK
jgi:cobalt-precorrin-5B (C1)-methyltransferase